VDPRQERTGNDRGCVTHVTVKKMKVRQDLKATRDLYSCLYSLTRVPPIAMALLASQYIITVFSPTA